MLGRDLPTPGNRLWCGVRTHSLKGGRGGGGSIVRKTPDTSLYSTYVSTLWFIGSVFVEVNRLYPCVYSEAGPHA